MDGFSDRLMRFMSEGDISPETADLLLGYALTIQDALEAQTT